MSVPTTAANAYDSQYLDACLCKMILPQGSCVLVDKGYCAQTNETLLRSRGLRSGIQRKAYRNRPREKVLKRTPTTRGNKKNESLKMNQNRLSRIGKPFTQKSRTFYPWWPKKYNSEIY